MKTPRRLTLVPRTYSSGWTAPAPSGGPMLRGTVKPVRSHRGLVLSLRSSPLAGLISEDALLTEGSDSLLLESEDEFLIE